MTVLDMRTDGILPVFLYGIYTWWINVGRL
jgi:hypothetical protein